VQRSADCSRNAHQSVESGQSRLDGLRDHVRQRGPGGSDHRRPFDGDLREAGIRQSQHNTPHSLVAHQQVRTPAQDARRHLALVAGADDLNQFVGGPRCNQILRRPTRLQPGAGRQGFVAAGDVFEAIE
jgi:hypothetical protein